MAEAWTKEEAIRICTRIEKVCKQHGCHVALTGGLLYKAGARTDLDIVFYRIRQVEKIDTPKLINHLEILDIKLKEDYGFVKKFLYMNSKEIDAMFPEHEDGEYPEDPEGEDNDKK